MKLEMRKESIIPIILMLSVMVVWIFLLRKYNSYIQQIVISLFALMCIIIIPRGIPKQQKKEARC